MLLTHPARAGLEHLGDYQLGDLVALGGDVVGVLVGVAGDVARVLTNQGTPDNPDVRNCRRVPPDDGGGGGAAWVCSAFLGG